MSLIIYHNPRCAKSRTGLNYLQSRTSGYIISDYMKNGLSIEELRDIVLKINLKPYELIRKNEEVFKKELKGRNFTDDEWMKIISENPRLLRRPLIVGKHKAIIGDPVQNIDILF